MVYYRVAYSLQQARALGPLVLICTVLQPYLQDKILPWMGWLQSCPAFLCSQYFILRICCLWWGSQHKGGPGIYVPRGRWSPGGPEASSGAGNFPGTVCSLQENYTQCSLLLAHRFFCWSPAPPAGECQRALTKALLTVWGHIKSVCFTYPNYPSSGCLPFTISSDMEHFTCPKLTGRSRSMDVFSLLWGGNLSLINCSQHYHLVLRRLLASASLTVLGKGCLSSSSSLNITLTLGLMSGARLFSPLHLF